MIDGITILNSEVCNEGDVFCGVLALTLVCLSVLCIVWVLCQRPSVNVAVLAIGIFSFTIVIGICGTIVNFPSNVRNYTIYEVTISNDVSMIDFYNHYNIIEQRGDIFVITEKEN